MPKLQDILVGKLALRRDLVDPLTLHDCVAEQRAHPQAPLGQILVRRRIIAPAQLIELMAAVEQVQLQCGACQAAHRPAGLDPSAGLACPRCGGTLRILLGADELSDRFATGRSARAHRDAATLPLETTEPLIAPPSVTPPSALSPPPATRPDSSSMSATRPDSQQAALTGSARFRGSEALQGSTVRLRGALVRAEAGTFFGPYEVVEELGRGGMGVVYKARQPTIDRLVALKVLLSGALASGTQVKRFQREAELTARLKHPGIVHVHDVGQVGDFHYFTMDFVDGPPLSKLIKERQLGVRRAVELARDVARALHHAHERGAIHRDVKPGNIIIGSDGAPVLTDFGLARDLDAEGDERLTRSGAMVGTPYYMAPEQAQGKRDLVSARSDVYALGVVLFEMLTFELPFRGETQLELTNKIIHHDPPRPSAIEPTIDRDLDAIVLKALAKQPQDRHASAEALAVDLDRFLRGERVRGRGHGLADVLRRARRGWRRLAALAGAGLVVALGAHVGSRQALDGARRDVAGAERDAAAHAAEVAARERAREQAAREAQEVARRQALEEAREALRLAERTPAGDGYRRAVEAAVERLSAAIAVAPDDLGLRLQRARLARRLRNDALALRDLDEVRRLDPGGPAGSEAVVLQARWTSHEVSEEAELGPRVVPLLSDGLARAGAGAGAWRDVIEAMLLFLRDADVDGALAAVERAREADPRIVELYTLEATIFGVLGRLDDALRACERALEVDPKDPFLWLSRARVSMGLGNGQGALDDVNRALELDPDLEAALTTRVTIQRARGQFDAAIRDVRALLERRGDDVELLLALAQLCDLGGRRDQADAALARVEAVAPGDARPWMLRASRHLEQRALDDVLVELRRGLRALPQDATKGRKQLGDMLRRIAAGAGLHRHLLEHAREVLAERPGDVEALTLLAEGLLDDERTDEALARLDEALARAPDHLRARELRVLAAFQGRSREAALAELERFGAWAQGKPAALGAFSRLLVTLLRDHDRARVVAERVIALDKEQVAAHLTLGFVAFDRDEFPAAHAALRRAAKLAPDDPEVLSLLGATLFHLGELDEAQVMFDRALTFDTFRTDAAVGLSTCLLRAQRWRDCAAFGRTYMSLFAAARRPPPVPLVLNVCEAFSRLGQVDRAISLLQELVRVLPHPDLKLRLARAYDETGQRSAALGLVEEVLRDEPEHPVARAMRARLGG
ncbi:MAG: tetratricopeptide repeat protein [Planctomycetes bacterium]|nr:tetratricopeptide repeat protein [Planctomycetota bacterium]